jgi:hypothetical protein
MKFIFYNSLYRGNLWVLISIVKDNENWLLVLKIAPEGVSWLTSTHSDSYKPDTGTAQEVLEPCFSCPDTRS